MPRNMSFALTTRQILDHTKTVTRRTGWATLQPGDHIWAVKQAMGLKKGAKVERLALLEVIDVRDEPLDAITPTDVAAEGFPDKDPEWFIAYFLAHLSNARPGPSARRQLVRRIEFCYVPEKLIEPVLGGHPKLF